MVTSERYLSRIIWYFPDEGEEGATIGEDPKAGLGDPPTDRDDWEDWCANKVAREANAERDRKGFFWDSAAAASAVLRQIREALKQDRPLPEWAKTALAEGWKAPKGWKA